MKLSNKGRDLIKQREGLRLQAYLDTAFVWTIGYGQTGHWVKGGVEITQEEADGLLDASLKWAEAAVTNGVKVPLSQVQYDTLVSFVFNIGEPEFKTSTLLRELNKGNYDAVPAQLLRWNKVTKKGVKRVVRGLTIRRSAEASQWNSLIVSCGACSVSPCAPQGRKASTLIAKSKTAQAGATVAATGGYSFVTDLLAKAQELKTSLISVLPDANMAFFGMCLIGMFIIYNRISDSNKGRAY